ncbi:hypothetical protein [Pandoravirus japonicus]|uniref:Uncharacterized protein n=1 Tax=Pandoravirus japonicus TaxID=2823154 RepID=A0A811BTZ2_9VIRU|nr:hypothetical protein [Pandoravirus japonicus]
MEAVTEQDRQWLDKSLACVTCDGRVDAEALGAVEFAHDFAKARTVLAAERAKGIAPAACFELPAALRCSRSGNIYALSVQPDRQTGRAWTARSFPDDRDLYLSDDDALAALVALSAHAADRPFRLVGQTSLWNDGQRLCSSSDTWLVCMSEALALQSMPWDLAAVDRELALARALVDLLVERQTPALGGECGCATVSPLRLRAHGDDIVDAYGHAARLFDDHGLSLACGQSASRARENAIKALNVFIAGVERMQATPAIYLGAIAPAIAARVEKDFAHRHADADAESLTPAETTGCG